MSDNYQQSSSEEFTAPDNSPQWFLDNLQCPGESHYALVNGNRIHFLSWNLDSTSLPVLVFMHGFGGNANWWSFLIPFFTDHYRVVAIDLPGMGDSGYPQVYNEECFAQAIIGVIRQYQLQPATIIGHSFGGVQALRALGMTPELFNRAIVVDSVISLPPMPPAPSPLAPRSTHQLRADRDACIARFRLIPPQPLPEGNEAIYQFISYHSCVGDENGWHWKFDPKIGNYAEIDDIKILAKVPLRVDCIYGELSLFNADYLPARILANISNAGDLVIIPGGYHHLMLDKPLELVAAIQSLLEK
jgi:pimeloyl-ACP methyl ester carboxylesterase